MPFRTVSAISSSLMARNSHCPMASICSIVVGESFTVASLPIDTSEFRNRKYAPTISAMMTPPMTSAFIIDCGMVLSN